MFGVHLTHVHKPFFFGAFFPPQLYVYFEANNGRLAFNTHHPSPTNSSEDISTIARKPQKQDSVPGVMGRRVLLAIPLAHNSSEIRCLFQTLLG